MCQQQFEAEVLSEQQQYMSECDRADAERDMEHDLPAHKRTGYFEMMCEMADEHRKWLQENGI